MSAANSRSFRSLGGWSSVVVNGPRGTIVSLDWFEEGVCVDAASSVEFVENYDGHRFQLRGSVRLLRAVLCPA